MKTSLPIPVVTPAQPKWFSPGSFNPLFNRLIDNRDGKIIPVTLNKEQLIQSIMDDIALLLNTRCTLKWEEYIQQMTPDLTWGVPDLYGLPDFLQLDPKDKSTWNLVQEAIQNALRIFEPRLKNPKVSIERFEESKQNLVAHIQGAISFENMVEPLNFSSILE